MTEPDSQGHGRRRSAQGRAPCKSQAPSSGHWGEPAVGLLPPLPGETQTGWSWERRASAPGPCLLPP